MNSLGGKIKSWHFGAIDELHFLWWLIVGRNKFSIFEIRNLLIEMDSIIIHCISYSSFSGTKQTMQYSPMQKLKTAATKRVEISCSTIKQNENFYTQSCTGPLALILFPKTADSITNVSHSDTGSLINEKSRHGRRHTRLKEISIESVRDSILNKIDQTYNEWNILGYGIVGIIFLGQLLFNVNGTEEEIPESEIHNAFPHLKFYAQRRERFHALTFSLEDKCFRINQPVSIDKIYEAYQKE